MMQDQTPLSTHDDRGMIRPSGFSEKQLWLPPERLRTYERHKVICAILFEMIFLIFLALMWSILWLRFLTCILMVMTVTVTRSSILNERVRAIGRQVAYKDGELYIWIDGQLTSFSIADVKYAAFKWTEEGSQSTCGFHFYDKQGEELGFLDENLIAEEAEARSFLGWLRDRHELGFEIKWPIH